jgi:hypothetical protein
LRCARWPHPLNLERYVSQVPRSSSNRKLLMNEEHRKALKVFYPEIFNRLAALQQRNVKFVQYTSADAAMKMITNNEVWLRNTRCMNDYREVEHGIDCLVDAYRSDQEGKRFKTVVDRIIPETRTDVETLFDSWIPHFRFSTFITCVSEHPPEEDKYGRLSMWRAYGGKRPVAVVMNRTPFECETDALEAYAYPVLYHDREQFRPEFGELADRLEREADYLREMGPERVKYYLFELFKVYAFCIKHPGFAEEREWRVVYNPVLNASPHVLSRVVSIDGVPQEIQTIPLRDIPEEGLVGISIPQLIDKIIIGPNEHQLTLGRAFERLLGDAGCENPDTRVHYSWIPIR